MSDSVIARISQAPNLRVMASSAVARFAGANVDPLAAARELKVRAVLTGHAVGRRGSGFDRDRSSWTRATAATSGASGTSAPSTSIATLPAEIATRRRREAPSLACRARTARGSPGRRPRAARPTSSGFAGRQLWARRRTDSDLEKALGYFQKALDADPQYARAWTGIAETWDVFGYTRSPSGPRRLREGEGGRAQGPRARPGPRRRPRRARPRDDADRRRPRGGAGIQAGARAGREFPQRPPLVLAPPHEREALGRVARAEQASPRARPARLLERPPRRALPRQRRPDAGPRAVPPRRGSRHDNFRPRAGELGRSLLEDGRTDEAIPELETAHRLDPESSDYRQALAEAYEKAGRPADAARLRAEAAAPKP